MERKVELLVMLVLGVIAFQILVMVQVGNTREMVECIQDTIGCSHVEDVFPGHR